MKITVKSVTTRRVYFMLKSFEIITRTYEKIQNKLLTIIIHTFRST